MTEIDLDMFIDRLIANTQRLALRYGPDSVEEYSRAASSIIRIVAGRIGKTAPPAAAKGDAPSGSAWSTDKTDRLLEMLVERTVATRTYLEAHGREEESLAHADAFLLFAETLCGEMGVTPGTALETPELAEYRRRHGL